MQRSRRRSCYHNIQNGIDVNFKRSSWVGCCSLKEERRRKRVAELPYNGDTISMMIFLPTNADGLDTLLRTLSATQIGACASQLEGREFQLSLPNFKLFIGKVENPMA